MMHQHNHSSMLQGHPMTTSLQDNPAVTAVPLRQWTTTVGIEKEDTGGVVVSSVVVKVHSTTITVTANVAGAQVSIADASNNAFEEIVTVSSLPAAATIPLARKHKANDLSQSILMKAATSTENETAERTPQKRQSRNLVCDLLSLTVIRHCRIIGLPSTVDYRL
jgi:hypothetical protein